MGFPVRMGFPWEWEKHISTGMAWKWECLPWEWECRKYNGAKNFHLLSDLADYSCILIFRMRWNAFGLLPWYSIRALYFIGLFSCTTTCTADVNSFNIEIQNVIGLYHIIWFQLFDLWFFGNGNGNDHVGMEGIGNTGNQSGTPILHNEVHNGRSSSSKVVNFGTNRKARIQLPISYQYQPWSYLVPFQILQVFSRIQSPQPILR